jgi:uncharacterized pyridoxamine 5'-phosphate oxidase family protein
MDEVLKFLKEAGTFYLATMDGSQPRVRPLGAVCIIEGKLYICTNNTKPMYAQMTANPQIEISATGPDGRWLRLTAEAAADERQKIRQAMLDALPSLQSMYKADDGKFEVFYLYNAKAVINSFSGDNKVYTF